MLESFLLSVFLKSSIQLSLYQAISIYNFITFRINQKWICSLFKQLKMILTIYILNTAVLIRKKTVISFCKKYINAWYFCEKVNIQSINKSEKTANLLAKSVISMNLSQSYVASYPSWLCSFLVKVAGSVVFSFCGMIKSYSCIGYQKFEVINESKFSVKNKGELEKYDTLNFCLSQ